MSGGRPPSDDPLCEAAKFRMTRSQRQTLDEMRGDEELGPFVRALVFEPATVKRFRQRARRRRSGS